MTAIKFTWWVPPRKTEGQWFSAERCFAEMPSVPSASIAAIIGPQGPAGQQGLPGQSGIILPGRIVTSGNYIVVTKDDGVVLIASADAQTVMLPNDAQDMQQFVIKDTLGICASKPIAISSQTGPIDGASSFTLGLNYQTLSLIHIAGNWSII